jgi:hypothetical protein
VNDDATPTVLEITTAGDVSFSGNVGNVTPVAGVAIGTAHTVTFAGSTHAGYIKQVSGTGVTTLHDVVLTGPGPDPNPRTLLDITTSSVKLLGNGTAVDEAVQFNFNVSSITQQSNTGLTAAALALKGTGEFLLNSPHNDVATLAADIVGSLSFGDLNDLTVGTVGPVKGITTHYNKVKPVTDVRLNVLGRLTIGSGAGEDLQAASGGKVILAAGDGVLEETGSGIVAGGLGLQGAGEFNLSQPRNHVKTLFAEIRGNLDFHNTGALEIGSSPDHVGISTGGGNVRITTGGILTVKGKINTGGTAAGKPEIIGNPSNVHQEAVIEFGTGTVTFVVPG